MPPAEFEPTIPASERPQTHALDRFLQFTDFNTSPEVKFTVLISKFIILIQTYEIFSINGNV
jgi:hypothetical protein